MSMKMAISDSRYRCNPTMRGNPIKTLYKKDIDYTTKNCIYTVRDEIDIQKDINSYRDSCSLEQQLIRLNLAPVDAVISSMKQVDTFGADISNIPNDLMEYFLMRERLSSAIPNVDSMINSGMTFDDIIKSLSSKNNDNENNESEVNDNGENE